MKKIGANFLILNEKDIKKVIGEYLSIYRGSFESLNIEIKPSEMGGFDTKIELIKEALR